MRFVELAGVVAVTLSMVAMQACAAPPVPDNLGGDSQDPGQGTKASDDSKSATVPSSSNTSSGNDTTGSGPPPSSGNVTVTVTVVGGGSVTSTPAGVTCTGTTCTGSFAAGTSVTIAAAPTTSALFDSWSGGCTGSATCTTVLSANVAIGATFVPFDGPWKGTMTNTRSANGCNFTNNGNLSSSFTTSGTSLTANASMDGFELRDGGCNLVSTENGSASASSVTVSGGTFTGNWSFNINNANGSLGFPYTATLSGKTLTGKWTCSGCSGGFTITKQ